MSTYIYFFSFDVTYFSPFEGAAPEALSWESQAARGEIRHWAGPFSTFLGPFSWVFLELKKKKKVFLHSCFFWGTLGCFGYAEKKLALACGLRQLDFELFPSTHIFINIYLYDIYIYICIYIYMHIHVYLCINNYICA